MYRYIGLIMYDNLINTFPKYFSEVSSKPYSFISYIHSWCAVIHLLILEESLDSFFFVVLNYFVQSYPNIFFLHQSPETLICEKKRTKNEKIISRKEIHNIESGD